MITKTYRQFFRLLLLSSIFGATQVQAYGAGMAIEPGWSKQSGGPAIFLPGDRTGAPGSAGFCADCHDPTGNNGGPFKPVSTTISVSGNPSEYVPGNTYTITIRSQAAATPGGYGFQMVVLENGGNTNIGTLSNNSPAATHIAACAAANIPDRCQAGRIFFEHEYSSTTEVLASGNTWTVSWTAPAAGAGAITIYAISNAVDGNGNRNGDSPALTNTSLSLNEQAATIAFTAIGPFSIDENRGFGSVVGDVDATLGGGMADAGLTYSVVGGTGSPVFSIEAATGVIKVISGSLLDYESFSSATLAVQASDGSNQVNATITINVNNLNDNPPVFTHTGPFTIDADAANGSFVGNLSAHNGDLGSNDVGITYSIVGGNDAGAFSIASSGGVISVLDAAQLAGPTMSLDIQVDDGLFQTVASATINIGAGGGQFVINQGMSASWFNSSTSGQGFLIDIRPSDQFMFVAWFTFDDTAAKVGSADNRWLVASGNYSGDTATLELFRVSGGVFNDPQAVAQVSTGTLTISFSDCENGLVDYDLPDDGLSGQIEIVRALPGTEALCHNMFGATKQVQQKVAAEVEPAALVQVPVATPGDGSQPLAGDQGTQPSGLFEINQGITASWFNAATAGQGFLFDVEPATQFIFVAWFTYVDADNAKLDMPEQRWLVASGNYTGDLADLDLFAVSGGLFDDPQGITNEIVGSITLAFSDCNNGIVEYSMPSEGLAGQIEIVRALPGTEGLCESLASGKQ